MLSNDYLMGLVSNQMQADRLKQAEQARVVRILTAVRRSRRQK